MARGSNNNADDEWVFIEEIIKPEFPKNTLLNNFYQKKRDKYFPVLKPIFQTIKLGDFNDIELIEGHLVLERKNYGDFLGRNSVRNLLLVNCEESFQPVIYHRLFIFNVLISDIEPINKHLRNLNQHELVVAEKIRDNLFYININMHKIPLLELRKKGIVI
ncbi:MAG: hypothetical protein ACFFDB_00660 [Promethearchaeota archaeon]